MISRHTFNNCFYIFLKTFNTRLCAISNIIACCVLVMLMSITVADVFGRYVFNRPIAGTFELTEFMMVSLVFLAMGSAQKNNSHISVSLFTQKTSSKACIFSRIVNKVISTGLLLFISAKSFSYALALRYSGEISAVLKLPVYPFVMIVSFGSLLMALEILFSIFEPVDDQIKNDA